MEKNFKQEATDLIKMQNEKKLLARRYEELVKKQSAIQKDILESQMRYGASLLKKK